jgi:glycosyltransferase involved in cell wall biosynthesis
MKITFLIFIFLTNFSQAKEPTRFCIISPGYNTAEYFVDLIESVRMQDYKNWHMYIIDDHSTDNSAELIQNYIIKHQLLNKIHLVANEKNMGAVANIYNNIHKYCEDEDVTTYLEGDDLLARDDVLSILDKAYQDEDIWLTYGNFDLYAKNKSNNWIIIPTSDCGFDDLEDNLNNNRIIKHSILEFYYSVKNNIRSIYTGINLSIDACKFIPPATSLPLRTLQNRLFRDDLYYRFMHLKTFKTWLFKKIDLSSLIYDDRFFKSLADVLIMYPMAEMASNRHIKYIPDIIYHYRQTNFNDRNIHRHILRYTAKYLKLLARYQPL